jgi:hypothetical protein
MTILAGTDSAPHGRVADEIRALAAGACPDSIERESDMGYHRGAVGDLALGRRLQVDDGRLAVEVRDDEVRQQAGVGAAGADDLDGGFRAGRDDERLVPAQDRGLGFDDGGADGGQVGGPAARMVARLAGPLRLGETAGTRAAQVAA